jgi:hypothetical protein
VKQRKTKRNKEKRVKWIQLPKRAKHIAKISVINVIGDPNLEEKENGS